MKDEGQRGTDEALCALSFTLYPLAKAGWRRNSFVLYFQLTVRGMVTLASAWEFPAVLALASVKA
jgi:hypothetical protein